MITDYSKTLQGTLHCQSVGLHVNMQQTR